MTYETVCTTCTLYSTALLICCMPSERQVVPSSLNPSAMYSLIKHGQTHHILVLEATSNSLVTDSHSREKRLLLDEVVQAKKEKELLMRESSRKDQQIQDARDELDKTVTALRSSETRIQLLKNQVLVCQLI